MSDPTAFVLYDDHEITELVCAKCMRPEDDSSVAIPDVGTVVCDRCGEVA